MLQSISVLDSALDETYIAYAYFTKSARTFTCCPKVNFFFEQGYLHSEDGVV